MLNKIDGKDAPSLTRRSKLDLIWSRTHPDFRGIAGEVNPEAWRPEQLGRRTILAYKPGVGTVLKLLDDLTDDEIAAKLPSTAAPDGPASPRWTDPPHHRDRGSPMQKGGEGEEAG
jgi:hypothetical protein